MSQRKAFREHFPDEIVIMRPGIRWPARVALAPENAEASPVLTGPKGLPRPLWALEELPVWTSLAVQWLRLCSPNAGGTGSISGQGTKIDPPCCIAGPKNKETVFLFDHTAFFPDWIIFS